MCIPHILKTRALIINSELEWASHHLCFEDDFLFNSCEKRNKGLQCLEGTQVFYVTNP